MKKVFAIVLALALAFSLCACNTAPPSTEITQDGDAETFNLPLCENAFDFHVRYYSDESGEREDVYAQERAWLLENPGARESNWRWDVPDPWWHKDDAVEINVVTTVQPWTTGYTEDFFESRYLVIVELTTPHTNLEDVVYRITEDGAIVFRPLLIGGAFGTMVSYWTVITEMDNRFQPEQFSVVFIDNPWAT